MSRIKCDECNGTGKVVVIVEKPMAMNYSVPVKEEEDCGKCLGTGWVDEDLLPRVLEKLDKIIKLLEHSS